MRILIITYIGFGDSIFTSKLIECLSQNADMKIDILTIKRCVPIFQENQNIQNIILYDNTDKEWAKYRAVRYIKAFWKIFSLRKSRYDIVLNNSGDFKFNILGWLARGKKNVSIRMSHKHPVSNVIRQKCGFLVDRYIDMPDNIVNAYEMQKYIAEDILQTKLDLPTEHQKADRVKIAIHPFASMKCKFWQYANWVELIDKIYKDEKILLFCAPGERAKVEVVFAKVLDKIEIVAENIEVFFKKLENVKLFIGLDSFSIHAAYYKGVPDVIMLNGANDSRLWSPPGAYVINGGENCKFFPCYNRAQCIGSEFEYMCMKNITVQNVLNAIKATQK